MTLPWFSSLLQRKLAVALIAGRGGTGLPLKFLQETFPLLLQNFLIRGWVQDVRSSNDNSLKRRGNPFCALQTDRKVRLARSKFGT